MRVKRGLVSRQIKLSAAMPELLKISVDAVRSKHAILDPSDPAPAIGTYFNFLLKHIRRRPKYDLQLEPAI